MTYLVAFCGWADVEHCRSPVIQHAGPNGGRGEGVRMAVVANDSSRRKQAGCPFLFPFAIHKHTQYPSAA